VENTVGFRRRPLLVPRPDVADLPAFNQTLLARCEADGDRPVRVGRGPLRLDRPGTCPSDGDRAGRGVYGDRAGPERHGGGHPSPPFRLAAHGQRGSPDAADAAGPESGGLGPQRRAGGDPGGASHPSRYLCAGRPPHRPADRGHSARPVRRGHRARRAHRRRSPRAQRAADAAIVAARLATWGPDRPADPGPDLATYDTLLTRGVA
jgi:hypothetical protein